LVAVESSNLRIRLDFCRRIFFEMRLDKLVAQRFGLSRRGAQEAVRRGQVDLAGQTCCQPGQEVQPDAPLDYRPNRPRPEAAARRLRILYQDHHILVVDKPAGLLTQPTPARESDTLLERAGRYLARARGLNRPYVGIVHRLDRDTSGVILLVCSSKALRPFQALFRAHTIQRRYLAVVEGRLEPPHGTIDLPIVADRGDGRRGASRTARQGISAMTHYRVMERFGSTATLVECRLETGRTHQIRIHLAEVGYPVVSESVYRPAARPPFPLPFTRQALHAESLGFVHPLTGQELLVEAPLPTDFADWVAALRFRFGGASGE
jgi:23S rRNA pseudouridine1911/1915/1917 synthase